MNFWDLIFDFIGKYFEWQKQIPVPGFEGVSLFELKIALFITAIVISGLISVVPNAAYAVGEIPSERRRRKERKERLEAERKREAATYAKLDEISNKLGDDD